MSARAQLVVDETAHVLLGLVEPEGRQTVGRARDHEGPRRVRTVEDQAPLPSRRGDRARFAKLWLFVRGASVSIFNAGGERTDFEERIAKCFRV